MDSKYKTMEDISTDASKAKTTSTPSDTMDFNYDNDASSRLNSKPPPPEIESSGYGAASSDSESSMPNRTNNDGNSNSHHQHDSDAEAAAAAFSIPVTRATYVFAMCAALNSCNLGYDIGVNTGAGILLRDSMNLKDEQLELFMGSLNLFAMIGALCASSISDRFGRRGGFIVAACGFIIGVSIMSLAETFAVLMFGRVFVGLGVGFGLAIDPIYISEISPASHRGRLVTWSEIATNVGIVLGFSSGLIFYNVPPDKAWRVMFGMGMVLPALLIFLVIFVMPESPRWLVSKDREEEAKIILKKVYPPGYDVDSIVEEIKEALDLELEAEHAVGWDVIFFPTPAFKRMLIVGLGSAMAQQMVGIDAIQYFLIFIIDESGIKNRVTQTLVLIGLGILKLLVIVVAGNLFDKSGRRPLFFMSLAGMAMALLLVSSTFFFETSGAAFAILGLAFYLAFFSLGMGPGAWLIPSEVFSTSIRAKAMSVATFLNRVTATLMSSTFLLMADAFTWGGYFLLLSIVCCVVLIFFYVFLPETKGKSLEDMSMYFAEITGDQSILDAEMKRQRAKQSISLEGGQVSTNSVI